MARTFASTPGKSFGRYSRRLQSCSPTGPLSAVLISSCDDCQASIDVGGDLGGSGAWRVLVAWNDHLGQLIDQGKFFRGKEGRRRGFGRRPLRERFANAK